MANCALLGGETAEMPDLYRKGDLDLAGFAVGVVEHGRQIDGTRIEPGDAIVALPSSGVHSNGYSLVRKLIARGQCKLDQHYDELGETLGEAVLRPTRIYVNAVLSVLNRYSTKRVVVGMAHVTGGGLKENIARAIPANCDAVLHRKAWTPPPVFKFLQRLGTTRTEMFRVFNMGIGFVMIVKPFYVRGVMRTLKKAGEQPFIAGRIERGRQRVRF